MRSACRRSSIPSILGILRSVMTRSMWCSRRSARPASPSGAEWTSYPSRESCAVRTRRKLASSSTTRICFFSGSIMGFARFPTKSLRLRPSLVYLRAGSMLRGRGYQSKAWRVRMGLPLRGWVVTGILSLSSAGALAADSKVSYPSCTTAPTEADKSAAKGAFAAGQGSFNEADYATAITYWRDAYRRDCTAHLLLTNLARAYELKGDRAEAVN